MRFILREKQCLNFYINNAKILCGSHFIHTKIPIFDGLSDSDFPRLAQKCDWERYEKGMCTVIVNF